MNRCKDCKHWNQTPRDDYEISETWNRSEGNWGRCEANSQLTHASYDGGCNGELLTQDVFGCILFERQVERANIDTEQTSGT